MIVRRGMIGVLAVLTVGAIARAMLIGPGKYSGVVFFDRWGGCILDSGVYVMYVSDSVKGQLRADAGKCIQVEATDVYQPRNPGEGLIRKFSVLGPANKDAGSATTGDLELSAERAFKDGQKPAVTIRIENGGDAPAKIYMEELAPTLLAKKGKKYWGPSDGPSEAVITDSAFCVGNDVCMEGGNETWGWKVTSPEKLERIVPIPAHGSYQITVSFSVPAGEYEFLTGYGGGVFSGRCITSTGVSFDVDTDGHAKAVNGPG